MTKVRNITSPIFCLALIIFWSHPVLAQLTKINVGYSAISGDALPASIKALARFIGRSVERDVLEKT